MDIHGNITTNNHDLINYSVVLPWEQDLENNDTERFDENDEKAQSIISEKKPIETILFIDDEEPVRNLFKMALEKFGYKVMIASDGEEGMALFREKSADLIITDIFMPKKDGFTFIFEIKREFPGTKIFAITGKHTFIGIETEVDIAETMGAIKGFTKPVKLSELLSAIKEL